MPPTPKKLKGQIGLGLFLCPSIYPSPPPPPPTKKKIFSSFEQTWQMRPCYIPNFKHLTSASGSEEDFCIFFYVFTWFKPRTPWGGAIWKDFLIFFYVFLCFKPRTTGAAHYRPGGHQLNKHCKGPQANITY